MCNPGHSIFSALVTCETSQGLLYTGVSDGFLGVLPFSPTYSDNFMVRASASGAGGRGFDPGPGHTKDFKNGTSGYLAWRSAL